MQFLARIRPGSAIDHIWRRHNRLGGEVSGVRFKLVARKFVSDILTADQVVALELNRSVALEAAVMLPPGLVLAAEPAAPSADPPAPEPARRPGRGKRRG